MKATAKLLVAALAAAGALSALQAQAQNNPVSRGAQPVAMARGGGFDHGARSGNHGGNWSGRWAGSGHWSGYHGSWAPRWSLYFGVPVFWGSWYWGAPYWYDYYPGSTVIYREVEREASYPEHRVGPATTEVPQGNGLPSQGPLYMNYCESAKAYFPKVTTCPEGWKLATPAN